MKRSRDFETTINGIPCGIVLTDYTHQPAVGPSADSDWDCYGHTDIGFEVLDRKGYPAKWLQSHMSKAEEDRIEQLCIDYMEEVYAAHDD